MKKKFEYKSMQYQKNVESKEQEIKLLVTTIYELRRRFEELNEQMNLKLEKTKGTEDFLTSLSKLH